MDSIINIMSNTSNISLSEKKHIFKILVIVGLLLAIFTYLFPNNYAYVITLIIFAVWVGNYYSNYTDKSIINTNNRIMYHLNVLQEITNMYIDKKLKDPKRQFKLHKNEIDNIYNNNKLSYLYLDSNLIEFFYYKYT